MKFFSYALVYALIMFVLYALISFVRFAFVRIKAFVIRSKQAKLSETENKDD